MIQMKGVKVLVHVDGFNSVSTAVWLPHALYF